MFEGRDLKKEIENLGIIAIEDYGVGSLESTFAALDAIRQYEEQNIKKEEQEERGLNNRDTNQ
ncbi:hypothetical protein [Treponema sp. R6D11]